MLDGMQTTKRRRKLTTPVCFPTELDADSTFTPTADKAGAGTGSPSSVAAGAGEGEAPADPQFGKYRLTSVIMHTGKSHISISLIVSCFPHQIIIFL